jgi:putative endonuclease
MELHPPFGSVPTAPTLGAQAEIAAKQFLEEQGFQLVTRNFRSRRGEIDLIMQKNTLLIFVEVRLRQHHDFGGAAGSVTLFKQQKIIACAKAFLQHQPRFYTCDCRFDVIAIQRENSQWQIDWLPAAFTT